MRPFTIVAIAGLVVTAGCGGSKAAPAPMSAASAQPAASAPMPPPASSQPSATAQAPAPAPSRGPAPHAPACSFISREEMAELLGAPVGKPSPDEGTDGETSCTYPPADAGSWAQAETTIEWNHGDEPSFERMLADALGGSAVGRRVAHDVRLGDEATYSMEGVLSARAGRTLVTITLPMRPESEPRALAIGRKLFERLGLPTAPAAAPAKAAASVEPTGDASAAPALPNFPDGLSVGDTCPAAPDDASDPGLESTIVPLTVGLTLSQTWVGAANDYEHECLIQVTAVTSSYVDVTQSCPVGADHHVFVGHRRLCRADLRDSFFYRTGTAAAVPPVVTPASMFSLSTRSFHELKSTGNTRHRYIEIEKQWRTIEQPMHEDTDGTLHAERLDRQPYTVIVNDRPVDLPVVLAMSNAGTRKETTAKILDDERFPLVLDYATPGDGFRIQFSKISYPTGGELEKHLAVEKRVDVYGIYFDFASDRLRPESTPVLTEIAGALANNPEWKLGINGHTDNIGGDAANMDLSRRRGEAVRRALVEQYHVDAARLATAGFGASQPKETNATIEGRAKNRRVELIRQ